MVQTITVDQLTMEYIILRREFNNGTPGNVSAQISYFMSDVGGYTRFNREQNPPIPGTVQTQLKNLWDMANNFVENAEGL